MLPFRNIRARNGSYRDNVAIFLLFAGLSVFLSGAARAQTPEGQPSAEAQVVVPTTVVIPPPEKVRDRTTVSPARIEAAPPPGFEELIEPQTTIVDLYYGDRRIGSVEATFTPQTIEFTDPSLVTGLIPTVTDPKAVTEALSGSLSNNSDLLCGQIQTADCGVAYPEIAA